MDILIFALISGFIFYKLYNILGETNDEIKPIMKKASSIIDVTPEPKNNEDMKLKMLEKSHFPNQVKEILEYDPNFSESNFIKGAAKAYEMIFQAFSNNDDEMLKYLLSDEIYQLFTREIEKNKTNDKKIEKIVISLPSIEITNIIIKGNIANIAVQFKSEQMIIEKNINKENLMQDSKTIKIIDNWCFEKKLDSKEINWKLVKV